MPVCSPERWVFQKRTRLDATCSFSDHGGRGCLVHFLHARSKACCMRLSIWLAFIHGVVSDDAVDSKERNVLNILVFCRWLKAVDTNDLMKRLWLEISRSEGGARIGGFFPRNCARLISR